MSDYDSSLPVRTENDGDVVAKIADATIPSQQLKVNPDGSINVTDNGGSLTVDGVDFDIRNLVFATDKVDVSGSVIALDAPTLAALESITVQNPGGAGAVNIQDGGNSITVDAIDLDIRDLDATQDNIAISDGVDTLSINADGSINITDNGGSITVDGTVNVSNLPLTVDTNYGTVGANTIRTASQIGNATGAADFNVGATSAQTLRVEANQGEANPVAGAWPVLLTDGIDTVAVNTDGSLNVRVSNVSGVSSVVDFNTAVALASGASSTHTYTSTGNFYLEQVEASASGKLKIEIAVNAVTKFVQFNSTANPNLSIHIDQPILATSGQTVTIVRTNLDNQAQDVYSTIVGYYV